MKSYVHTRATGIVDGNFDASFCHTCLVPQLFLTFVILVVRTTHRFIDGFVIRRTLTFTSSHITDGFRMAFRTVTSVLLWRLKSDFIIFVMFFFQTAKTNYNSNFTDLLEFFTFNLLTLRQERYKKKLKLSDFITSLCYCICQKTFKIKQKTHQNINSTIILHT